MHKTQYLLGITMVMIIILFSSCKDDVLPKPPSQLRLDFPEAEYASFQNHCPISFDMNIDATIKEDGNIGTEKILNVPEENSENGPDVITKYSFKCQEVIFRSINTFFH